MSPERKAQMIERIRRVRRRHYGDNCDAHPRGKKSLLLVNSATHRREHALDRRKRHR